MRKDPLPVFCFHVRIDITGSNGVAFFKSVSGLKYETEIVPVREGGANDTTFNLLGSTKWSNLVFKQGFTGDSQLLKWREEWLCGGEGKRNRANGVITQLDSNLNEVAKWAFTRGWPCKWELSEFDASKSELAIETLEIAHEGLQWSAGTRKRVNG